MSQFENFVRAHGGDMRQYIGKVYLANGEATGLEIARRWIWEIADHVGEVHGPTFVVDMLRETGEAIQLDVSPSIEEPAGDEPDPVVVAVNGQATHIGQLAEAFVGLTHAVQAMQPAAAPTPTPSRRERFWSRFDNVTWWALFLVLGVMLAEAAK